MINDALASGEVIYGEVNAWEHKEADQPLEQQSYVYLFVIEVDLLKGCQFDTDIYEGAHVNCFVPAKSPQMALESLVEKLKADHFELVDIVYLFNADTSDWSEPEKKEQSQKISEARSSGYIIYGEFDTWKYGELES